MKVFLKNITKIQAGYFTQPAGFGDLTYLQVKYFDENGNLSASIFPDLMESDISEKHVLQNGDILFAAKGTKNFASVYSESIGRAVASTAFFVIRIIEPNLFPEYLAWQLNHPNIMNLLKSQAIGSSTPSISKQVLENVQLYVPTFEKQKLIIAISKKLHEEAELKQKIQALRHSIIDQQIFNTIKST